MSLSRGVTRTGSNTVAFGEAGEYLANYRKGERISVAGRLQTSEYTDREGLKRSSVEVVVLRSDPSPLTRRTPAEPEPEATDTGEEPVVEAETPTEPAAEPAPKSRRRKKVAA